MIILGIDPGTATIGFSFLEKEWKQVRILDFGVISTPSGLPLHDRILILIRDLRELMDLYHPTICGIERLFFLRNVTNGIDVAQARWAILLTLAERGIRIDEFTPLQVKKAITWHGMAKKPQVQKALQMILHLEDIPQPDDAADALAIAYITSLKYSL
jgi:crossover junction endodeoxyribonuclease RuvC